MPPLDGLTLPDYQPPLPPVDVRFTSLNFKTGKETNLFAPGDQLALEVKNNGNKEAFIELIGISVDGGMIIHQPPTPLGAGMTYQYPHDRPVKPRDSIAMGLPPGVDRYVLFAADGPFPAGVRLHAPRRPTSPTGWCIRSGKCRRTGQGSSSASTRPIWSRRRCSSRRALNAGRQPGPTPTNLAGPSPEHYPFP